MSRDEDVIGIAGIQRNGFKRTRISKTEGYRQQDWLKRTHPRLKIRSKSVTVIA